MTAPNMATITESLERSLQNCSLNHERKRSSSRGGGGGAEEGIIGRREIYYINWRNGMKAREDPRTAAEYSGDFYSEDDDDDSSYDSEESSSESSPSSRERGHYNKNNNNNHHRVEKDKDNVLVVAGCKSCLMYFMVPKKVEDCPKCNGQLLHFDRS
ncbi:hypothetical protein CRYUN_Cryun06bG0102100 [Craigia yunnanensis]